MIDLTNVVNHFWFVVLLAVCAVGSLVDLGQAAWIVKRHFARRKRRLHAKIKSEIMMEEFGKFLDDKKKNQ